MPKEIYVLSLRSYILEQKRLQRDYFFKKMMKSVFFANWQNSSSRHYPLLCNGQSFSTLNIPFQEKRSRPQFYHYTHTLSPLFYISLFISLSFSHTHKHAHKHIHFFSIFVFLFFSLSHTHALSDTHLALFARSKVWWEKVWAQT